MKSTVPSETAAENPIKLFKDGRKRRVLLVGGGAREHAIGDSLCKTNRVDLYVFAHNSNPGLLLLATEYLVGAETDTDRIVSWAQQNSIDFVVIGLEDPLAVGLPDALQLVGIPTVGPVKAAARLETSKLFLRELMRDHNLPGAVDFQYVTDTDTLERVLCESQRLFALKPVGLTAGKGVKVMGVQLQTIEEAIEYGRSVIEHRVGGDAGILLEECLEGPEFTLQAFVDSSAVLPMPLVKDYKLAYDGDIGPNTGSMGSYSRADHSLEFVSESERREAGDILKRVIQTVQQSGTAYRGIAYGQFMKTRSGIRLIEINARFGDPEAVNVLSLLQTDFVDVCDAMMSDSLDGLSLRFAQRATVCKYVTPRGYPLSPELDAPIRLDLTGIRDLGVQVFFAKVEGHGEEYLTTSSRSIALLGTGATVEEAHQRVESALKLIHGDYHVRHDIGTSRLTRDAVAQWIPPTELGRRVAG